jgi:hypothetical protein
VAIGPCARFLAIAGYGSRRFRGSTICAGSSSCGARAASALRALTPRPRRARAP